jgi:thymidylate kinase
MRSKFAEIHFCTSLKTKIAFMIDGITINYEINDYEAWEKTVTPSLDLNLSVGSKTGKVRTKKRNDTIITTKREKWETFYLEVKEVLNEATGKQKFYLKINGSLHKNHFSKWDAISEEYKGSNYLPFTWQDLQYQINHVCKNLCINPNEAQISTLEVGLNICTTFKVTPFLKENIINYKGHEFIKYPPGTDGKELGFHAIPTQYEVKIYDKGLQYDLPENLMRFELKFKDLQSLNERVDRANKKIKTLSDLQDFSKVYTLKEILIQGWNDVLIFDVPEDLESLRLKKHELNSLDKGQHQKNWDKIKRKDNNKFNDERKKFKKLVAKYGNNWQTLVNDLLKNEWENLFKISSFLPNGKNEYFLNPDNTLKDRNKEKVFTRGKRYCVSCGNELNPAQKKNSKYCSAKYVGYERAHQCRNNNSNPRNHFKNKIKKITGRGLLFDIMPYFIDNNNKKQFHAI